MTTHQNNCDTDSSREEPWMNWAKRFESVRNKLADKSEIIDVDAHMSCPLVEVLEMCRLDVVKKPNAK